MEKVIAPIRMWQSFIPNVMTFASEGNGSQLLFMVTIRLEVFKEKKKINLTLKREFLHSIIPCSSSCFRRWKGTSCRPSCPSERVLSVTSCWAPALTLSRVCPATSMPSALTTQRQTQTCSATSLRWRPGPFRAVPTH